jgi:hypothetical protein
LPAAARGLALGRPCRDASEGRVARRRLLELDPPHHGEDQVEPIAHEVKVSRADLGDAGDEVPGAQPAP